MAVIGLLPASGKASRIGGLPKFSLPISNDLSLLGWHVKQMNEVCDEVRISTRSAWVPIIQSMDLNVKLLVKEPSTMSDALVFLAGGDDKNEFVVGMPDTFMVGTKSNIYRNMLSVSGSIILGLWPAHEALRGKVGQILAKDTKVIESRDKDPNCEFDLMWGTMLFRDGAIGHLRVELDHPGKEIQDWLDVGKLVTGVHQSGKYMDIGTFEGLKALYSQL
jgi:hypothetical protein